MSARMCQPILSILIAFGTVASAGAPALAAPEKPPAQEKPRVTSVTVSPSRVKPGASPSTGTVTLSFAPKTITQVNLISTNPQVASVPGSTIVAKGTTQGTFKVTFGKPTVTTSVGIDAMCGGSMRGTTVVVEVPEEPRVRRLELNPSVVAAGGKSLVMVYLNVSAPAGGQPVALSYDPAAMIKGPSSVTVPERAVATDFWVTAATPAHDTAAAIKAQIKQNVCSSTLKIKGSAPVTPTHAIIDPSRLRADESAQLNIQLSDPAPAGGMTLTLTCSSPSNLDVPSSAKVSAGETFRSVLVRAKAKVKNGTVKVTVSANGGSATATVDMVAEARR